MIPANLILFVLFNYTIALNNLAVINSVEKAKILSEGILCRNCGNNVSSSSNIVSRPSSAAQKSVYDILYGKDVLIQVFVSDIFFQFPVLNTDHSSCVGVGEWEESNTWYPGFRQRPCSCSECGAYVGWVFEPMDLNWANPRSFFGLILTNIIGESFVDSLMQYPEEYINYDY